MRKLTEKRLLVATHNAGKLEEIRAMMAPHGIEVTSAGEMGLAEPAETVAPSGHMWRCFNPQGDAE